MTTMKNTDKLHLVTRKDLTDGQQAVQAAHALREFVREHPETDQEWYSTSNHLAFLAAKDESALERLVEKARWEGVPVSIFREPDLDNALTAIAIAPSGKKLCRRLPVALMRRVA